MRSILFRTQAKLDARRAAKATNDAAKATADATKWHAQADMWKQRVQAR
eukprot:SAG22_NODE_789_length_7224_cov_2.663953_7_plen_49_part_00